MWKKYWWHLWVAQPEHMESLHSATSEFSLFNDLVPKLQREDERLVAKSPYLAWGVKCRSGENERKFRQIQCGWVKNYLCERGIQLSDSDKGGKKVELLDLCKKAAAMKQIQLAASAQDRKSCWRRNYKQVWAKDPKILDAWMHNLCNFPKFSFGVHVQPSQTWLKFPIVIS